jgi:hypothetical protein
MNAMKKWLLIFGILAILPAGLLAGTFIDWRGGFYVTYPDDWFHVPYNTVNIFLQTQDIDLTKFDYDAVLSLKTDKPFFVGPYVFIALSQSAELSSAQIDSILRSMSQSYGKPYVEGSLSKTEIVFRYDQPVYDRQTKTVAVASIIRSEYGEKVQLEIRKFYENGTAFFMCYSPTDVYLQYKPVFLGIANSFSTKDLDQVAPKENFKVVDLSQRTDAGPGPRGSSSDNDDSSGDSSHSITNYVLLPLAIIAILLIVIVKKMKRMKNE